MTASAEPTIVVGAGPYGLAASAHLRAAGIETHHFGTPMEFWDCQMPVGMCLRSSWDASHISDPGQYLTLDRFEGVRGVRFSRPLPLHDFIDYGRWFQRQVAPNLDNRRVEQIEWAKDGFRVRLRDGDEIAAARVVIAAGISPFAYRPRGFAHLSTDVAPHSSAIRNVDEFANRRVLVVGGGQSALETAALLGEAGADVEIIVRRPAIRWLNRSGWVHNHLGPTRPLLYPPTDVGPPGLNQLVARPDLFRRIPRQWQQILAYRAIRPAVSDWLRPRLKGIQITTGRSVTAAEKTGNGAILQLNDGTTRHADTVVLATGYQVNVSRYAFLARQLVDSLQLRNGYPVLAEGFESSVSGLHFLGAPAADSYGPLMRFVSGTSFAARRLTRYVIGRSGTRQLESASAQSLGQLATGI